MMRQPKGFSLLEILVAFSIMAVALTIVLRIFGAGVNNAVISEEYNTAVQIAESILARTGVETPLEVGEVTGIEGYKYHWLVSVSLVHQAALNANPGQASSSGALYAIRVLVVWDDAAAIPRRIDLQTFRLV
jgi:general secretion pathway protein I